MSVLGPGDRIAGRYRLLEELGGGGMGVVFRARDEEESRDVAVKILRRTNPEAVRRLQREARATRRLDPERVAEVYDAGETEAGEPFLVMEYVEGRTLRALLLAGALERAEVLQILREIATTLGQAHAAGLVHRDVKPDNVIVRADGRVVLLDFGIVKHIDLSGDAAQVTTLLTSEGAMIGTPAYLAPEQALGRDVAPAVDQFALAVTAFELLTGKLPWTATEVTRMLAQLLADRPPPASTLKEGLSKSFDAVLWRGLSKSPVDRFPSVEKFVEALEAAERGIVMASPASQTLDVPAPSALPLAPSGLSSMADASPTFDAPASTAVPLPKSRKSLGALAFVALVGVSVGGIFLARGRPSRVEGNASGAGAAHALGLSSHAALACPIFAVEGLPEIASQLGAAAASFACARAKWYLGGSDDRVVVPAALLDAPAQPGPSLPDLYDAPDARSRTLGVTKARGLASLDGTVTRRDQSWRLDLVVRAEDGREIARTEGEETPYLASAIRSATSRLWQTAPLAPEPIDPDVARWTAYPTIETGLMDLDLREVGARAEACARVGHEGAALGRSYFDFSERCHLGDGAIDAGALAVDRSSPSGLVTSVNAILTAASTNPFSEAEMRGLASEVESMRATESSHLGRASLDRLAGLLWSLVHDTDRAHTALLSAVADDPLFLNDWFQLQWLAGETGSSDAVKSLASVWFPQEPEFLRFTSTTQSDVLPNRLRDGQLAYLLEPTPARTRFLGRALAEAGRAEEVRALIVATPVASAPDPSTAPFLLGCIDLHDAMFARALPRFEAAGAVGLRSSSILGEVLGHPDTTAAKWALSFASLPDPQVEQAVRNNAGTVSMCMTAGAPLAGPCLARVERLGARNGWGVGGDLFLLGAKRLASGDVKGAVSIWRPIVAGPNDDLARLLPTVAFERAGEPDLAARIDARKMAYRQLAGISEATPREARRAFNRGDRARAKELAKSVVQAWEVADATIPAVGEMRGLLAKLGD